MWVSASRSTLTGTGATASATAACSSSWSFTLAARSVRTTTRRTPPPPCWPRGRAPDRRRPRRSWPRSRGPPPARPGRRGGAEQLLEPVAGQGAAWGRKLKIPPPSLSTTTTVRSTPRSAMPMRAFESWRKAMSPSRQVVGAPVARATPVAVDRTPSMPLAPRLACTCTSARGRAYHSTSRTGIELATTRWAPAGRLASSVRAVPGSVGSGWSARTPSMASSAAASSASHRSIQPGSGSAEAHPTHEGSRWAGRHAEHRLGAPEDASHSFTTRLAGGADPGDGIGPQRLAEARHPQQGVGVDGDRRADAGSRARPPRGPARPAPTPDRPPGRPPADAGRAPPPHRQRRTAAGRWPRRTAGASGWSSPGSPTRGSRSGRFRCTGRQRPRPPLAAMARHDVRMASSAGPGSGNHRTARPKRWSWSMVCGAATSAVRAAGRPCTPAAARGVVGLHHGCVEVGSGGAARAEGRPRGPPRQPGPESRRRCSARRGGPRHRCGRRPPGPGPAASTGCRAPRTPARPGHAPTRRRRWRRRSPGWRPGRPRPYPTTPAEAAAARAPPGDGSGSC